jgi:hypothetical protein
MARGARPAGHRWAQPFRETAPWLVACFAESYGLREGPDGQPERIQNYYVQESCGIACGFLIAALHHMGLTTLTRTPARTFFFPSATRPPVPRGPDLGRKPLGEILQGNRGGGAGGL